jgi:hypothetical protein
MEKLLISAVIVSNLDGIFIFILLRKLILDIKTGFRDNINRHGVLLDYLII